MKQRDKMLQLLTDNANKWVDIWSIITKTKICHYTNVIMLLRQEGYKIENKTQKIRKNGEWIRYSWYMLVDEDIQPKTFLQKLFG